MNGAVAREEQCKKNNVESGNMKSSNVLRVTTQEKQQCERAAGGATQEK